MIVIIYLLMISCSLFTYLILYNKITPIKLCLSYTLSVPTVTSLRRSFIGQMSLIHIRLLPFNATVTAFSYCQNDCAMCNELVLLLAFKWILLLKGGTKPVTVSVSKATVTHPDNDTITIRVSLLSDCDQMGSRLQSVMM